MRIFLMVLLGLAAGLGCARVRVEAPKEPIKLDVSMRLDIYQHVEKDIAQIENIVSGSQEPIQPQGNQSRLDFFIGTAFAEEGLSPEVEQAALRRRDRRVELTSWEQKGVVGENRSGLVEIRNASAADPAVEALVRAENADRMLIYQELAEKNGTPVESVQSLYAKRLQADAPAGTPIEVADSATGAYAWTTK